MGHDFGGRRGSETLQECHRLRKEKGGGQRSRGGITTGIEVDQPPHGVPDDLQLDGKGVDKLVRLILPEAGLEELRAVNLRAEIHGPDLQVRPLNQQYQDRTCSQCYEVLQLL